MSNDNIMDILVSFKADDNEIQKKIKELEVQGADVKVDFYVDENQEQKI